MTAFDTDHILTEQQQLICETARHFAQDKILPHAARWDETNHFPVDVMTEAAKIGFAAIYTPEKAGGTGLSRFDSVLIFEQLSQACPATTAFMSIHNMVIWMIAHFGSEFLYKKYCPQMANMDLIGSYCLTESSAGSDAGNLKTKAIKEGDIYKLTGTKQFISGAGVSDIYLVMARTGEEGPSGISAFIVDKETQGISFGINEKKMGWHCQPTRQVIMDEAIVPQENRIGEEGDGFKIAMKGLDGGRVNIAACSLGGAQYALNQSLNYVKDRQQFGHSISEFQTIQFKLSEMETNIHAARLMLYEAAKKIDNQAQDMVKWCAMAKIFVTDKCFEIANQALQLHGGYGYLSEYNIERIVRDLRVHQILEGTNEIMNVIIARHLLK